MRSLNWISRNRHLLDLSSTSWLEIPLLCLRGLLTLCAVSAILVFKSIFINLRSQVCIVSQGNGFYNLTLILARVAKEDVERTYYLRASNDLGREEFAVRISTMDEPAGEYITFMTVDDEWPQLLTYDHHKCLMSRTHLNHSFKKKSRLAVISFVDEELPLFLGYHEILATSFSCKIFILNKNRGFINFAVIKLTGVTWAVEWSFVLIIGWPPLVKYGDHWSLWSLLVVSGTNPGY